MSDIKELIKKRASFKGRLTSFINYLDTLCDVPIDDDITRELQLRIGKMELLFDQYDEVQLQIECKATDSEEQYKERQDFESRYYQALARAQGLHVKPNSTPLLSAGSEDGSRANRHLVKLPTIQLPKFSGSYDNYLEFRDTFTSLIHDNDDIDDINKFHYLRTSLEGSAAVVIQSVQFSASNYSVAWKLLCDRFDNKRLLLQNHVSALFNIETITKESSVTLKRLIDQVNKNLRALESLKEPVKQWDTLLIHIITHKLDHKTYREWEEYKGRMGQNDPITFDDFLAFIRNRADLLETLELSRGNQSYNKSTIKLKSMVSIQGNTSRQSNIETTPRSCPMCEGNHNLSNCSQFLSLTPEARLELLPKYKLCFNCFLKGHFANTCRKLGCKICKRRHNSLIHVYHKNQLNRQDSSPEPSSSASPSKHTSSGTNNNISLSTNVYNGHTEVLLSTALIKIYDNNNQGHIVRAVLDSGSTSSLITERLCQRLNLDTSQVTRSILGINNAVSTVNKTCHVRMMSLDNNYSAELDCFVLPVITSSVPCSEINISNFIIPPNICMADPMWYKPADVDILIGCDLFWDLLGTQQLRLGKGRPVICETKLGWVVSGPIRGKHTTNREQAYHINCNFTRINSKSTRSAVATQTDSETWFRQRKKVRAKSHNYSAEEYIFKNTSRLKYSK